MTRTRAGRSGHSSHRVKSSGDGRPGYNCEESPLVWLASRKDKDGQPLITHEQLQAGERLRRDFTFALLGPRVTANWSALPSEASSRRMVAGGANDLADNVIAARDRVNRAIAAVGPELSGVLLDVCCYLRGLETLEKAAGWPQRSAKIVLTIALQQLARHYGLLGNEQQSAATRPARIRHWGAEGYRPVADPQTHREKFGS